MGTKVIGGYLFGKAKEASDMLNSKIDENENLKSTKDATKEKLD